jgi:hypothetical protein
MNQVSVNTLEQVKKHAAEQVRSVITITVRWFGWWRKAEEHEGRQQRSSLCEVLEGVSKEKGAQALLTLGMVEGVQETPDDEKCDNT